VKEQEESRSMDHEDSHRLVTREFSTGVDNFVENSATRKIGGYTAKKEEGRGVLKSVNTCMHVYVRTPFATGKLDILVI
jgi:hypothetical protein